MLAQSYSAPWFLVSCFLGKRDYMCINATRRGLGGPNEMPIPPPPDNYIQYLVPAPGRLRGAVLLRIPTQRGARACERDAFFKMNRSASRAASLFCCGIAAASSLVGTELLPETELRTNCYNFPAINFHKDNSVKNTYSESPHLMLELGAPAVDFTLHDIDGSRWNLGEVLKAGGGKPVVLIFGMLTCPAYQGLDSGEESTNKWTYWHEHGVVSHLGGRGGGDGLCAW